LVFTHLKRLKMAKVKFSALISEMRNKLNGSVFSRNRGGAYLRNKVTPLNPQTAAQVEARSLLAQFSQGWRALTQVQRDAWSAAVSNWTTTDVFGDSVKPTGATLYIRLNINISIAGGTPINTPPAPIGVVALTAISLDAAETGDLFEVSFAATPIPAGHAMVVESTTYLSPGISNANSQFRVISVLATAIASPQDVWQQQIDKFGGLVAGQKVFVRAKMIRLATGETSQKLVASAIVGA
jgi:hypothetical protein